MSHIIHSISFGEVYPSMVNPLDNTPKILHEGSGYFQYHIKVRPRPLRTQPPLEELPCEELPCEHSRLHRAAEPGAERV